MNLYEDEISSKLIETEFDIIIDDANHFAKMQIKAFNKFYPLLKNNGIYLIEDLEGMESAYFVVREIKKIAKGDNIELFDFRAFKNKLFDDIIVKITKKIITLL